MGTGRPLTVNMKASIALVIGFLVFWVVSTGAFLLTSPFDLGALLSLAILTPIYIVLLVLAWKREPGAYLGNAILSTSLLAATVIETSIGTEPFRRDVVVEVIFLTVILALMSLEGFKAYLELRA